MMYPIFGCILDVDGIYILFVCAFTCMTVIIGTLLTGFMNNAEKGMWRYLKENVNPFAKNSSLKKFWFGE